MQNNDNQKTYFIYVRSTGEKVPVTKEQHDSFYKEADRIRHKEQDHGRCMCPYRFIWKCDGDCIGCEYHAAGDITSLDQPLPDGNGTLGDYIPDRSKPMEEVIADRMLLEQLFEGSPGGHLRPCYCKRTRSPAEDLRGSDEEVSHRPAQDYRR